MRKAIIFICTLALVAATILGVMIAQYTDSYEYKSNRFEDGYIINGVHCYGLNYDQAAKKITSEWNSRDILIVGAMDEPLATIGDQECTFNIKDQVAKAKENHILLSTLNHYLNLPVNVKIPMKVEKTSEKFKKTVTSLDFLSRGNVVPSQNAYVDLDDPDFRIVKEVYGNKPDSEQFFSDILRCIEMGQTKFVFTDEDYVDIPDVKSDDPKLLAYQKFCRDNLDQKITYDLGEDSYTISRKELLGLLKDDQSGDANEEAVKKFVVGVAERYDNIDREREFRSLTGRTVTIRNAHYGWQVDQEEETRQLIEDIESHEDVKRQPEWASQGYGDYSLEIGNTYIDIDISKQKLIYFKNGKKAFTTDVVTGCRNNGTTTPTGLFSVLNKATNVTLKGRNSNGSKYSSFVNYWMAFLGSSYGMHDATWRSEFGGDIWISSGSHGCVNIPPANMPKLFEMVEYNTPVLIYE